MKKLAFICLGISVIANVFLVITLVTAKDKPVETLSIAELRSTYAFLSPRVFLEQPNDIIINFVDLRQQLREYHSQVPDSLGIYFEYLPSGVSIGVNEKQNFVLASLLKVPLVMGIYQRIERGELKPTDTLTVTEENLDPYFGNLWKKGVGATLTVQELINLTLRESDNTAQRTLFASSPDSTLENVFDSLDIPKELEDKNPVVNAKNYSSVLRSLYLSSYLAEENSNHILELLTETAFNDKIAAGVPASVKVAHKIGVHHGGDPESSIYTDCGIVYVPMRPYILCIMTRSTEPKAQQYMRDISRIVYDYVASKNRATP